MEVLGHRHRSLPTVVAREGVATVWKLARMRVVKPSMLEEVLQHATEFSKDS